MKKFNENENVAVLTTKFVLIENEPITHIYHYEEDGMWEFASDRELKESDYKVVSLDEIVMIDPSVLEVADLKLGSYAHRKDKNSDWRIGNL